MLLHRKASHSGRLSQDMWCWRVWKRKINCCFYLAFRRCVCVFHALILQILALPHSCWDLKLICTFCSFPFLVAFEFPCDFHIYYTGLRHYYTSRSIYLCQLVKVIFDFPEREWNINLHVKALNLNLSHYLSLTLQYSLSDIWLRSFRSSNSQEDISCEFKGFMSDTVLLSERSKRCIFYSKRKKRRVSKQGPIFKKLQSCLTNWTRLHKYICVYILEIPNDLRKGLFWKYVANKLSICTTCMRRIVSVLGSLRC